MKKKNQKAALRKLQKVWYAELKRSGFNDIEHFKNGWMEPKALSPAKEVSHRYSTQLHEDTFEYYRSAGIFLHEYRFPSEVEKRIWELHSEGKYTVDIVLDPLIQKILLNRVKTVSGLLRKLKKEFKTWLHEVNKNGASK